MTETSACTILRPGDHDPVDRPELLASAGTDAVSFETQVVDQDDHECPPGVVGEIVTPGPALMAGYWDDREATDRGPPRRLDAHRRPRLPRRARATCFVGDRLKDMIVTGGENVYPREVEDVLLRPPGRARGGGDRRARRPLGRACPRRRRGPAGRRSSNRRRRCSTMPRPPGRLQVPEVGRAGRRACRRT